MSKAKFVSIRLGDVMPNPYRNMGSYDLQPSRLMALKESIKQTGFWNNIVARPCGDTIEIAYGHHRIEAAIAVLGEDYEHTFAVVDLPDYAMLQMMAAENSEDWGNTTLHNNEAVLAARSMLDEFCAKYPTWDKAMNGELHGITGKNIEEWFVNAGAYATAESQGVGIKSIMKFLNWPEAKVRYALSVIPMSPKQKAAVKAQKKAAAEAEKKAQADLEAAHKLKQEAADAEAKAKAEAQERAVQQALDEAEQDRLMYEGKLERDGAYDPKVNELFTNPYHATNFRDIAIGDAYGGVLSKGQQYGFAKKLIAWCESKGKNLSAKNMRLGFAELLGKKVKKHKPTDPLAAFSDALTKLKHRSAEFHSHYIELITLMKSHGVEDLHNMPTDLVEAMQEAVTVANLVCGIFGHDPVEVDPFSGHATGYFNKPVYEADLISFGLLDEGTTLDSIGFWAQDVAPQSAGIKALTADDVVIEGEVVNG